MAMTEEQKEAIRQGLKAYYKSHPGPMTGRHLSDETKAKIRERLVEFYQSHDGPQKGKPMSEETKEKIRQAMLRRSKIVTEATPEVEAVTEETTVSAESRSQRRRQRQAA